tara:strand:+ start:686 stop:1141 length:456 start_codon:yes stop_codon:yes gene_type:complete
MINAVRIILLIVALGVFSLAGFYFYQVGSNEVEIGNVKIKMIDEGVDVQIENFKVTHEVKGKKEWILKAGLAQVSNHEDLTKLKSVEMILPKENNLPYVITADSGTYQNTSKVIDLVGHVKMTTDSKSLAGRFHAIKDEPASPSLKKKRND